MINKSKLKEEQSLLLRQYSKLKYSKSGNTKKDKEKRSLYNQIMEFEQRFLNEV